MSDDRIGPFVLEQRLGAGGMGVVFQALDTRLGRRVALKLLSLETTPDRLANERLVREAQLASALNHPNVSTIYEVGEADGQTYIAMELVEGRPLRDLIPPEGMPLGEALRLGLQIADAVAHAHARGVIHRDLKSTNVLVTAPGDAKVLDFGLAKRVETGVAGVVGERSLTAAGIVVGTPHALAPEVLDAQPADARSDVWALGVLLYEMLCGRRPFQADHVIALAHAIMSESPADLPARVPAPVRDVVRRALAKSPASRYADAGALRDALAAAVSAVPEAVASSPLPVSAWARTGSRETPAPAAPPRRGGTRTRMIGSALAGAALAVAMWLAVRGGVPLPFLSTGPTIRSIAVLPLANLSGDPAQEYFANGMTEELITDLAPIRSLKVISRTSVMRYKNTDKSIPQIARELGVDGIVEGSVLRSGTRVRITAQLIDAAHDRHLWAESYERDFDDIIALQAEVARDIAGKIHARLTEADDARMRRPRPVNPQAYELYLRARHEAFLSNDASLRRAIAMFEQAIRLDPRDARYPAGLADSYLLLTQIVGTMPFSEGLPLAYRYADQALKLDPSSAEANTSMAAATLWTQRDWATAERLVRKAIELNPNYSTAHVVYSVILDAQARHDEGLREAEAALAVDPMSLLAQQNMAWKLGGAGDLEGALAACDRTLRMNPGFQPVLQIKLGILEVLGRYREAIELLRTQQPQWTDGPAAAARLEAAYRRGGAREFWREHFDLGGRGTRIDPKSHWRRAVLYGHIGELDSAFTELGRAFDAQEGDVLWIKADPMLKPLRSDPRFPGYVRRLGLEP